MHYHNYRPNAVITKKNEVTVVTAQNKMTAAVPGTLPEETEVKLSEFLAMADGVFQRKADGT